jgi:uncharacterized protein YkwD
MNHNSVGSHQFWISLIFDGPQNKSHLAGVFNSMFFYLILFRFIISTATGQQADAELGTLENEVFVQVNNYRKSKGKAPFVRNASMDAEARKHSQNMASGRTKFGHNGFENRVKNIFKAGLSPAKSAENVAYGYRTADATVKGWINSPGHRKNMDGPYYYTGIGVGKNKKGQYYYTQLFLGK